MNDQDRALPGRIMRFLMLAFPVLTLYIPVSGYAGSLLLACGVVWYGRKHIHVARDMKVLAILFGIYLVIFTVSSEFPARSLKGDYDILRGMLFFPVVLLMVKEVGTGWIGSIFTLAAAALTVGNVAFPRDYFMGYYENPNNVAVTVLYLLLLLFPLRGGKPDAGRADRLSRALVYIGVPLALVVGAYLLYLANSRAVWVGAIMAALLVAALSGRLRRARDWALVAVGMLAFLMLLEFLNSKGLGLTQRNVIWYGLLNEAAHAHLWFGSGINSAKDIMAATGLPTSTAHNLLLEIFVSSGIVGLCLFSGLIFLLVRHLMSWRYDRNRIFYTGLAGLAAFLVISMVDLKFASYKFSATMFLFLALVYSQRVERSAQGRREFARARRSG